MGRFPLFVLMVVYLAVDSCHAAVDCNNWRDLMDPPASILFIAGDRDSEPPVTQEQLDSVYCQRHLAAIDTVKDITRSCLKPFPQQVVGLIIRGSNKETKAICRNNENRLKLIELFKCIAQGDNWETVHNTFDGFVVRLQAAHEQIENPSLQMSYGCCEYHKFVDDLVKKFSRRCDRGLVLFMRNVMERKTKDALDLVCSGYTENDRENCRSLRKDNPVTIERGTKPKSKSVLLPLIDIFTAAAAL